ncbi:YjjG family noncanonical pyrimidine nucleotidase [Chryseobacterium koreense]|uniref:HAD family hydrolase n=1 Tax=Chryseobacterium koreense CCUG 49689 TaxID=1304281 RepID=A0A0J7J1P0_9FLAO|nr:YjjG family noncanonical pyrimidine nucleotidase [Chryseobacterium koreense]KMQ71969.1 HAD family hydrolase [Chryseobacterium koreense CCUG 49689]MBB5332166.1 putative hydrolase of the HAD superfamily [Chryseobacterium koreense]
MKIQHIFFDLDNTLWDHRKNAYHTLKEIYRAERVKENHNLDFEDFHREYFTINERLWEQIRDGEIDKEYLRKHRFYDSFLFFGIDDFELAQTFENNFLDTILKYNDLVEGAFEILEYLSAKKYQLHILSNGFKEVTYRKCELSGIKNYFETITSADEINIRKPQPEIYEYALKKSGAQKEESMMIGDDWIADVEGAKSFGLKVVFFDVFSDNFSGEDILVIKKLEELRQIL